MSPFSGQFLLSDASLTLGSISRVTRGRNLCPKLPFCWLARAAVRTRPVRITLYSELDMFFSIAFPNWIWQELRDSAWVKTRVCPKIRCPQICNVRRKFRSQTSDNMDRWKAEMGRVREKRRVEERRSEKKSQKKEAQVREKVGKSRNTVFFQWFVAPEGPKVGSLKPRVRSHLARWEMKNCTPCWREAHFEV